MGKIRLFCSFSNGTFAPPEKTPVHITLPGLGAVAQVDSLKHTADSIKASFTRKQDSTKTSFNHTLDSIQGSFNNQVDSLKGSYAKAKGKIESTKAGYQHEIDSLKNLKLPTEKYSQKIDSLNNKLAQVRQNATAKIDSLKSQEPSFIIK